MVSTEHNTGKFETKEFAVVLRTQGISDLVVHGSRRDQGDVQASQTYHSQVSCEARPITTYEFCVAQFR